MEYITAGLLPSIQATALLFFVLFGAWGTGALGLKFFARNKRFTPGESAVTSFGVGMFLLGMVIWILGVVSYLNKNVVMMLLAVQTAAALYWCVICRTEMLSGFKALNAEVMRLKYLPFAAALVLSWVNCVAPPTGIDALSYHLTHPKFFIQNHSVYAIPFTREALWPYLTEMWFTLGLMIDGTALAKLFHWIFYPMCAAAVWTAADRMYGRKCAYVASLFIMFTPVFFAQSSYAYVDLSLAFFTFWAFYLALGALNKDSQEDLVLSGIFTGAALSVKLLALGSAGVMTVMLLFVARARIKHVLKYCLAAAIAGGGWYIRSWVLLGNPVYPFFPQFFGGNGNYSDIAEKGLGTGPSEFFSWIWNMTVAPIHFGGEMLGPWILLFLPLALLHRTSNRRRFAFFLGYSLIYTAFLFTESQQVRFFASVIPLLTLLAAVGLVRIDRFNVVTRKTAAVLVMLLAVIHIGLYTYRSRDSFKLLTGALSAYEYLAIKDRSFNGYAYLNANVAKGQTIYNAAAAERFYDADHLLTMDNIYTKREINKRYGSQLKYLQTVSPDYIWVSKGDKPEIQMFIIDRGYAKQFSYRFIEKPEIYEYEIYKLNR